MTSSGTDTPTTETPSRPSMQPTAVTQPMATADTANSDLPKPTLRHLLATNLTTAEISAHRKRLDETIWAREIDALEHERTINALWDRMRSSTDPGYILGRFNYRKMYVGELEKTEDLGLGIRRMTFGPPTKGRKAFDIRNRIDDWRLRDYRLDGSHWRQVGFKPATAVSLAESEIAMALYISGKNPSQRVIVRATLHVTWSGHQSDSGYYLPITVEVRDLVILDHEGDLPFREVFTAATDSAHPRLLPLLLRDINGDGLSEIICGGLNKIYFNRSTMVDPKDDLNPDADTPGDDAQDGSPPEPAKESPTVEKPTPEVSETDEPEANNECEPEASEQNAEVTPSPTGDDDPKPSNADTSETDEPPAERDSDQPDKAETDEPEPEPPSPVSPMPEAPMPEAEPESVIRLESAPLFSPASEHYDSAIVGDFTGDGWVDIVCVLRDQKAWLFAGNEEGQFAAGNAPCCDFVFTLPKSMTAGDIDGDGDLDLFIGQFKFPFEDGSMPTPFDDANDGHPWAMLQNDGQGRFTDVTADVGLDAKRFRRVFGASLADLDDDGHLDLLVTGQFSGVDFFHNDGKGHFTDVTSSWVEQPHQSAISHRLTDINGDGRVDIFISGIKPAVATRLDQVEMPDDESKALQLRRQHMTQGNRLLVNQNEGEFQFASGGATESLVNTGWSFGCTTADFDLNGQRDVYINNGYFTGRLTTDYASTYWRHDIFTGTSQNNHNLQVLFSQALSGISTGEMSWNGLERNALLLNVADDSKTAHDDVAFLLGLGFGFDSRAVVSDDLDGDGRPDLILVEHQKIAANPATYVMHVLQNKLPVEKHWVGVRLSSHPGRSPLGAKVTLKAGDLTLVEHLVTGESFSAQHAPTAHFGLGDRDRVESIEVVWPGGQTQTLTKPAIDQYHQVSQPPTAK